ncbi:MAG: hypothetical protein R3A78_02520 [Polyangiales bacterium]
MHVGESRLVLVLRLALGLGCVLVAGCFDADGRSPSGGESDGGADGSDGASDGNAGGACGSGGTTQCIRPSYVNAVELAAAGGPALHLVAGADATWNVDTGELNDNGATTQLDGTVESQEEGVPERIVFHVGSLAIDEGATLRVTGSRAVVLLATGDITIDGTLDISADRDKGGPGGATSATNTATGSLWPTSGRPGQVVIKKGPVVDTTFAFGGAGGGSNGNKGGDGGNATAAQANTQTAEANGGAPGDAAAWTASLVGGGAGGVGTCDGSFVRGGGGGGALVLTSQTRIVIGAAGHIRAAGAGGRTAASTASCNAGGGGSAGGGGAGGTVVLEAREVHIAGGLYANGGGGGGGDTIKSASPSMLGQDGQATLDAATGGDAGGAQDIGFGLLHTKIVASAGGAGGANATGGDAAANASLSGGPYDGTHAHAGGGGGGLGRIVIRTESGDAATDDGTLSPSGGDLLVVEKATTFTLE